MPFDAAEVARQIEETRGGVRMEERARATALEMALRIYAEADETGWEQRVQDGLTRRWVGLPMSPLHETPRVAPSTLDYTVVATDSSFIAPDKHRGSFSHLINVGRVMIKYGDEQAAEIDNTPNHYCDMLVEGEETTSGRVLQAKCALRELQELYDWSKRYHPDVALVDGSLMQLVLVLSQEDAVKSFIAQYFGTLRAFRELGVPVLGYISRPDSQMVMRAVRMLGCEQETPCEQRPDHPCTCQMLWSINDADLFDPMLPPGQRSSVFTPTFSYLSGTNLQGFEDMVFAYMGTEHEIARLEFPRWVWEDGLLDRAMSIILHQCWLGGGYPNALTCAHQFAALHNADRESYFFLLERAGLMRGPTEKAHGKRSIGQAI